MDEQDRQVLAFDAEGIRTLAAAGGACPALPTDGRAARAVRWVGVVRGGPGRARRRHNGLGAVVRAGLGHGAADVGTGGGRDCTILGGNLVVGQADPTRARTARSARSAPRRTALEAREIAGSRRAA